ncbi:MAG: peroxiredoxin [Burkholderiaceae bacterium]|nr:peroxiredoxin [Burkholderiaceae bacterium]
MKHAVALLMMLGTLCLPVRAALDVGDSAPNFTLPAALGGKVFQYTLSEHLAKGPVVLYFFPAAFSEGCSTEARHFAEAIGQFQALGASVIGVSGDELEVITKFSVQVCQGKFPVAADEKKTVIKAYDAAMQTRPEYANRVSYVIAPDGKVIFVHLSLNPNRHVERTLAAVAQWTKDNPRLR